MLANALRYNHLGLYLGKCVLPSFPALIIVTIYSMPGIAESWINKVNKITNLIFWGIQETKILQKKNLNSIKCSEEDGAGYSDSMYWSRANGLVDSKVKVLLEEMLSELTISDKWVTWIPEKCAPDRGKGKSKDCELGAILLYPGNNKRPL